MRVAPPVPRQLFGNQLWETVAFAAKAAFLVLLTPLMLAQWGAQGYGEFALASSAFVLLTALDCGVRPRLRVLLCTAAAEQDMESYRALIAKAVLTSAVVWGTALLLLAAGAALPLLGFGASETRLIAVTAGMTALVSISGLLVEPLAARGRISDFKLAGAAGSFLALPVVYFFVRSGYGPATAIGAWLGCLAASNFTLFGSSQLLGERFWLGFRGVRARDVAVTLKESFWFGLINFTWLTKTHGLTFLVSQASGAAAAGTFFILLRLSEVVGTLCTVSSDAAIAALATARDDRARVEAFTHVYRYAIGLSLLAAGAVVLVAPYALPLWIGAAGIISVGTAASVACFGFASGLNRIITGVATGLGLARSASRWGVVEAVVTLVSVAIALRLAGLAATFVCASLAVGMLLPVTLQIRRRLNRTFSETWLGPMLGNPTAISAFRGRTDP